MLAISACSIFRASSIIKLVHASWSFVRVTFKRKNILEKMPMVDGQQTVGHWQIFMHRQFDPIIIIVDVMARTNGTYDTHFDFMIMEHAINA